MDRRLAVLQVAPEAAPFAKVGGLGDVTGSLPEALVSLGVDCRVLIPAWGDMVERLKRQGFSPVRVPGAIEVPLGGRLYRGKLFRVKKGDVTVYLLQNDELFQGPIYPWETNYRTVRSFAFLSYGALMLPSVTGWDVDIYHCHDWGTAILPIAMKWNPWFAGQRDHRRSVMTIHNLAHQGLLPVEGMEELHLPRDTFYHGGLEFFGGINLLKGALEGVDHITTVSPTYAQEIQTYHGGHGLDGVLRSMRTKITGILNGLDSSWSPETDSAIPKKFSAKNLSGKKEAKKALMKEVGLTEEGPVAVMVSRLVEQKGLDILLPALKGLSDRGLNTVIIGTGERRYEDWLRALERENPDRIRFIGEYNDTLARLAYAGGDMYLMPSLFEPCGISQLIAMRYGTVPVVREVGGLKDTVVDIGSADGTGVLFRRYDPGDLYNAVIRAMDALAGPDGKSIAKRAMSVDFSWNNSAPAYRDIYRKMLL
ncbi:glycogen synthase [Dethiosulfovibrio salsuginis]|uniref:Glycogen synthase n=1 Tax=Dethiosulfovibrio salsuginis TaxID=561720 RepID=A0A1X7L5K6_9BACT|nr:glycogen synthase [Dethiosulfovibrio salsuginis]SMG48349.1 starch synthase [Dethiosulfovibrio salsuginis]